MIVTKRNRPTRITHGQYRLIREWRPLKQLAQELGLSEDTAHRIRRGDRYKQVKA